MVSEIYNNRFVYYNMIKDFLEKKIKLTEFKNKYFNHVDENTEYRDPYFYILQSNFTNEALFKELFEEKNSDLLYNLEEKINAIEFSNQYCKQRHKDLDEDKKKGYTYEIYKEEVEKLTGNKKLFKEKYCDILYDEGLPALGKYEQGANELDIKGELFFMGIWNFIDNYPGEYTPSDAPYFNPNTDFDEKTLRDRMQAAFDVLERNKDRWM